MLRTLIHDRDKFGGRERKIEEMDRTKDLDTKGKESDRG
jgi:hypothetical protein